ncbi:hypothetical protein B0T11DRAFT_135301 [Plectosphaerella cucumerina]|uniref:Transmembrane protein n=1 Tax=Plectosphaerella cucumerina TaxID=40658 RepID=A0A8K0WYW2_9PEZI|nr:hypothetical protein B0T11DRAFT_135301 [Plectosphaerella cucumerina]
MSRPLEVHTHTSGADTMTNSEGVWAFGRIKKMHIIISRPQTCHAPYENEPLATVEASSPRTDAKETPTLPRGRTRGLRGYRRPLLVQHILAVALFFLFFHCGNAITRPMSWKAHLDSQITRHGSRLPVILPDLRALARPLVGRESSYTEFRVIEYNTRRIPPSDTVTPCSVA